MDNKQFFIEFLKYGAWPVVAGVAIFFLKDKLANIFVGVKSAKHGDTEIQFYEATQTVPSSPEEQLNLQHLIPIDPTGLREKFETKISQQLAQTTDDNEKIDVLVKNLAQLQISNTFEKVYYYIYGSQIRLLEFLSIQVEGKAPVQTITPFFDSAKYNSPDFYESQEFSNYVAFLLSWGLVENKGDLWIITTHGRAFITYITATQLTKNKTF